MDLFDWIEDLFEQIMESFSRPPRTVINTVHVTTVAQPIAAPVVEDKKEEPPMPTEPTKEPELLTYDQFKKIMPLLQKAKADLYFPHLISAMKEFEINTPLRAAAFLAQLAHESLQLKYFEEIASGEAYEGRKDLGNVNPGDGKRYKGRGPIQLTGRTNYRLAGKALGVDLENEPALAASPEIGFRTAGWFWKMKALNALADNREFKAITKKVNGGYNGLQDRIKYYTIALEVLGVK